MDLLTITSPRVYIAGLYSGSHATDYAPDTKQSSVILKGSDMEGISYNKNFRLE